MQFYVADPRKSFQTLADKSMNIIFYSNFSVSIWNLPPPAAGATDNINGSLLCIKEDKISKGEININIQNFK